MQMHVTLSQLSASVNHGHVGAISGAYSLGHCVHCVHCWVVSCYTGQTGCWNWEWIYYCVCRREDRWVTYSTYVCTLLCLWCLQVELAVTGCTLVHIGCAAVGICHTAVLLYARIIWLYCRAILRIFYCTSHMVYYNMQYVLLPLEWTAYIRICNRCICTHGPHCWAAVYDGCMVLEYQLETGINSHRQGSGILCTVQAGIWELCNARTCWENLTSVYNDVW